VLAAPLEPRHFIRAELIEFLSALQAMNAASFRKR
jgi:hypothetical protein